jgi:hypothetical protein
MLKRRLLTLSASAITAGLVVALTALPAASAPAAPAAAATAARAAAAAQGRGVVHIVHRGLVRDCEDITNWAASINSTETVAIAGQGVDFPVDLADPGNCFNLYNEFYYSYKGKTYTGYEYQNGDGHCLFNDGGTLEVGGACQPTDDEEQFFGIAYYSGTGWQWGVTADTTSYLVNAYEAGGGCGLGTPVHMTQVSVAFCSLWNFPTG